MNKKAFDIKQFVAIGDSITAGYCDGALFYEGQRTCFANLLATQFKQLGANDFKQAYLNKDSVGIGFFGNSRLIGKKLKNNGTGSILDIRYLAEQGDIKALQINDFNTKGPFNNLGIPGLRAITAIAGGYANPQNGEGKFNPYFTRMCSNPLTASVFEDAINLKPDFFTFFLGNNDVLAYALSGGTVDFISPAYGDEPGTYEFSVKTMFDLLFKTGARGVLAGIPDIRTIPYFNTIPLNGMYLSPEEVLLLELQYTNTGIHLHEGFNHFIIETPDGIRQIKEGELILLDLLSDPSCRQYLKGRKPIPKNFTLLTEQIDHIIQTVTDYNHILRSAASKYSWAFVDTEALIKKLNPDRKLNPATFEISYKNNMIFSLDGIHLSPLGQALLANEFIKLINKTFKFTIPKLKITEFRKKPFVN